MVIERVDSLFPIVQVTTWCPSLQTVLPDRIGWWAHAGPTRNTTRTPTIAAAIVARRTAPRDLTKVRARDRI
jgi:hypothetical protein